MEASWLVIHAGMGHRPERKDPVLDELSRDEALKALHGRRVAIEPAVALLAVGVEAGRHLVVRSCPAKRINR